ncbi:hypothetical protein GCM10009780_80950 [Actinomadura alba]
MHDYVTDAFSQRQEHQTAAAPDDNDDNHRHTIPASEHRQSTVAKHRARVTVGYGSVSVVPRLFWVDCRQARCWRYRVTRYGSGALEAAAPFTP